MAQEEKRVVDLSQDAQRALLERITALAAEARTDKDGDLVRSLAESYAFLKSGTPGAAVRVVPS